MCLKGRRALITELEANICAQSLLLLLGTRTVMSSLVLESEVMDKENLGKKEHPVVISLDGNIGAGKSTLLEEVRKAIPEVEVVVVSAIDDDT